MQHSIVNLLDNFEVKLFVQEFVSQLELAAKQQNLLLGTLKLFVTQLKFVVDPQVFDGLHIPEYNTLKILLLQLRNPFLLLILVKGFPQVLSSIYSFF